jgi:hypothetical protein
VKKFVVVLGIVTAFSAPAHGHLADIPEQLQGRWCLSALPECVGDMEVSTQRVLIQGGRSLDCRPLQVVRASRASYMLMMRVHVPGTHGRGEARSGDAGLDHRWQRP